MTTNNEDLFFSNIDETEINKSIIEKFKSYSENNAVQVYLLSKTLGNNQEFQYDIQEFIIGLIPHHPILLLNCDVNCADKIFDEFFDDLKTDLGVLSNKYEYSKVLDRPRKWKSNLFEKARISEFNFDEYLKIRVEESDYRKIDLLISLMIGSINSIQKVGINEPETTLDKIKQKIVLFDGKQSNFIYSELTKKSIAIQGLAGTGKTELLLYKLKEVFINEKNAKIVFTCYNNVLAKELKRRVPDFFDFLKIEEQIKWNENMFVFPSWGTTYDRYSGMYRYLCNKYNHPFYTYSQNSDFNELCIDLLDYLNDLEDYEPCFDYVFIDESQDFKEGFFKLCEKVAKKKVYIGGDIFQNIFDRRTKEISPDYLLFNCYRTDPRTLMIAHSIGMGLYEKPVLNWLEDEEWRYCGYQLERIGCNVHLSRYPMRRFEDIQSSSTFSISINKEGHYEDVVVKKVGKIREQNPTVKPDDIAIIVIADNYSKMCELSEKIAVNLYDKFGYNSTKGYISKEKLKDHVFISNVNNVKGLEFAFVICVVSTKINRALMFRNSVYMALTRALMTTYFIIDEVNEEFAALYIQAAKDIKDNGYLDIVEPSEEEKSTIDQTKIKLSNKTNIDFIIDEIFSMDYPNLDNSMKNVIKQMVLNSITQKNNNRSEIKKKIDNLVNGNF